MTILLPALALTMSVCASSAADGPIATISLFNPTLWQGPALVEAPTGRVATPGLVDWTNVRLIAAGEAIPFAIREGRAHWRARFATPSAAPRAEDLLVFWRSVPPGQWVHVDVVAGTPEDGAAVERNNGLLRVRYETVEAVLDERTGLLAELSAHGEQILAAPMKATCRLIGEAGYDISGAIGPGYQPLNVTFGTAGAVAMSARIAAVASTPAMTEITCILDADAGPALAVTYRIHAAGLVEVCADERPWTGPSPWVNHAVEFALPLLGESESLPYLEDRLPFYGFKDYSAVVKHTARRHTLGGVGLVELGEETVNGRRWIRRLYAYPQGDGARIEDVVEMLDEGLIVDVRPVCAPRPRQAIRIACPPQAATVARILQSTLEAAGLSATVASASTPDSAIRLALLEPPESEVIEEDGFEIRADAAGGLCIRAGTLLGLHQAVSAIAAHQRLHGLEAGFPLIARNPVVPSRGGGFGGGRFEVDFPYGTDEEWERTLGALLDSGMNVFWCLGMWGNWKLPVSYTHMPELRSDSPHAYDESSGALLSELPQHRDHGLKLMKFVQDRGGRVCVWLPIGCVPTTFAEQYPEAMSAVGEFRGRRGTPCFTHPTYRAYVDAFLKELIETYPLDGVVLVRDDNGGVCLCDRCKAYVAQSRTKDAVWEQYLLIYDWLRGHGFHGMIGVYPYFDGYAPAALEPHLPEDLLVCGHGASTAILTRNHARIGHMADTWLDNLYANFRLPASPRMRRLLSDRCSFWIGGAYCGTELPWEAIGYFGWEPTATPNSFRYYWGARTFGKRNALAFVAVSDVYERLWEINARHMLPLAWMQLTPALRERVTGDATALLSTYIERLDALKQAVDADAHGRWFAHMGLFPVFFEYNLRRLARFAEIDALVQAHKDAITRGDGLPTPVRDAILAKYNEIYAWSARYDRALHEAPGAMLAQCRNMTLPYKEWMAGYDAWLDPWLDRPQFAGTLSVSPREVIAGEPFTLRVELHNTGICPWIAQAGQRLDLSGAAEGLGLPASWTFSGEPMAPGDRRTLEFVGLAPEKPGSAELTLAFFNAYRQPTTCIEATATIVWST